MPGATLAEIKAAAATARPKEIRLPVVRDPVANLREFIIYEDGTQVEVPARKFTDTLAAEERFGRPWSELKPFSSTGIFIAYIALHRHEDEGCWPDGEFEDWVESVADYEMMLPVSPNGEADADPLATDGPGEPHKAASPAQEAQPGIQPP